MPHTPQATPVPSVPAPDVPSPPRRPGASSGSGQDQPGGDVFALPKLRLEIRDLAHPGARLFLDSVSAAECATVAVIKLVRLLYASPTTAPPTRSVTLILRDIPGVAYTTGSDLDNDHKEIHFSLSYMESIPRDRAATEIAGVVTHELVHCYQHNGLGTCPGGLIEGIADWVRLRCHLVPPHWTRDADGSWDSGYQKTAYFLEYLDGRFAGTLVQRLNDKLRSHKYDEITFWHELTGTSVQRLWKDYVDSLAPEKPVPGGKTITTCDGDAPTVVQANGRENTGGGQEEPVHM